MCVIIRYQHRLTVSVLTIMDYKLAYYQKHSKLHVKIFLSKYAGSFLSYRAFAQSNSL